MSLFYRDETIDDTSEHVCPICGGEIHKSFFWPMMHDFSALADFVVMALAVACLSYFAMYQLAVHFGIAITIPVRIGWISGAQVVVLIFLGIGCIVSFFLLKLHLKIGYWEEDYWLEGAVLCKRCGNRFLILSQRQHLNARGTIDTDGSGEE